ncbi:alkylhydroperoxidase [Bordetella trematum]|uniref:Arsenate reductase and related proteins, glutaredoxin family n=1 Tax=Bordetella trematum TaxID=123899 RepID=A0A157S936_9BORD|nr:carboxymuconolactone decarboxylase family protein [Bordetella trematum]AZR95073.1 alkylhydroperoxidase [Bordetella trematum]NNH18617.1 carboxymuconolactone decarboxylase family protein [Bordetella trematum]SAI37925.1 Arsenate reductase and related proteins%2C glutaredoxin family [Bordetella trematum]SAI66446.1 Arsenate reductase and related proteins%2C glutaredoxin family [Bordetella trematum]SUV96602.1 Arsenate reductase and related proteins, glutaredoxin family [Bordetella trematum]
MRERLNYFDVSAGLSRQFLDFSHALNEKAVIRELHDLITLRASQINGCAFCVDMHVKQARIAGERELRLHHVTVWRESGLFSARERAALAWTEALTTLSAQGVDDTLYEAVRSQFSDEELSDLTFLVVGINGWNRLNVAFRTPPGSADAAFGLERAGLS